MFSCWLIFSNWVIFSCIDFLHEVAHRVLKLHQVSLHSDEKIIPIHHTLWAASCKKSVRKNNSIRKKKSTRKHILDLKMCFLVDLFFLIELFFLIDFLHEAAHNVWWIGIIEKKMKCLCLLIFNWAQQDFGLGFIAVF